MDNYGTSDGVEITDERLARQAELGYDELRPRRPGWSRGRDLGKPIDGETEPAYFCEPENE